MFSACAGYCFERASLRSGRAALCSCQTPRPAAFRKDPIPRSALRRKKAGPWRAERRFFFAFFQKFLKKWDIKKWGKKSTLLPQKRGNRLPRFPPFFSRFFKKKVKKWSPKTWGKIKKIPRNRGSAPRASSPRRPGTPPGRPTSGPAYAGLATPQALNQAPSELANYLGSS